MSPRTRQSGFTLIELLAVICVIFISLGLLVQYVRSSNDAAKTTQAIQEMNLILNGVRESWRLQPDYASLTQTQFYNLAPSYMRLASPALRNPYGGNWTVAPIAWAGTANGGFSLTANLVPKQACVDLVTQISPLVHSIVIGTTELKGTVGLQTSVDPTTATTNCGSATANTIVFNTL